LGACAIDDPIDYTTSFEGPSTADSPSTADQDANNESFLSFAGVFAQDEAEVNTERRIQFSTDEAIEANKEYSVTIDGNEFKYTTTSSPDHQTLASQLAQAIDSNGLYSATSESNVIRIQTGAGTSSIGVTKAGALLEINQDPPTEALIIDNPGLIDVGFYHYNQNTWTSWGGILERIEDFYSNELNLKTAKVTQKFDGSNPNIAMLVIFQPSKSFDQAEVESMEKILESGGRIFFIGEHNSFSPNENKNISNLIKLLGGSIVVKGGSYNDNVHDRIPNKNLYNSLLNAGVNKFLTALYAELEIDPKISQAVVISDSGRIVVADQALKKGRITLIADQNWTDSNFLENSNSDAKVFLSNLAVNSYENQEKVKLGTNPNENFAPTAGTVETIFTSVASFNIVGQTLTISSTNEKIGKEIQFQKQPNGESKVEYKDEKFVITYKENVSTTEEIVALINDYPEFSATTTGNIIIP